MHSQRDAGSERCEKASAAEIEPHAWFESPAASFHNGKLIANVTIE